MGSTPLAPPWPEVQVLPAVRLRQFPLPGIFGPGSEIGPMGTPEQVPGPVGCFLTASHGFRVLSRSLRSLRGDFVLAFDCTARSYFWRGSQGLWREAVSDPLAWTFSKFVVQISRGAYVQIPLLLIRLLTSVLCRIGRSIPVFLVHSGRVYRAVSDRLRTLFELP